jgi:hypothetical protein
MKRYFQLRHLELSIMSNSYRHIQQQGVHMMDFKENVKTCALFGCLDVFAEQPSNTRSFVVTAEYSIFLMKLAVINLSRWVMHEIFFFVKLRLYRSVSLSRSSQSHLAMRYVWMYWNNSFWRHSWSSFFLIRHPRLFLVPSCIQPDVLRQWLTRRCWWLCFVFEECEREPSLWPSAIGWF